MDVHVIYVIVGYVRAYGFFSTKSWLVSWRPTLEEATTVKDALIKEKDRIQFLRRTNNQDDLMEATKTCLDKRGLKYFEASVSYRVEAVSEDCQETKIEGSEGEDEPVRPEYGTSILDHPAISGYTRAINYPMQGSAMDITAGKVISPLCDCEDCKFIRELGTRLTVSKG